MKYDWDKLEKEYILSDCKTVTEFFKSKNININGATQKRAKGWNKKRANKKLKKSEKIIEKVIEKEAEKEAEQIVNIKDIATTLANKIIEATKELDKHIIKTRTKAKTTKIDPSGNTIDIIKDKEEVTVERCIVDRNGLKTLTSALKDLNDILGNDNNNKEDKIDEYLSKLEGVIKNDK